MQSVELSVIECSHWRRRSGLRSASSHLRILLMLGICGFPGMILYSLSSSQQASAHTRASGVVAKVRVGRAPVAALLLVRSPQPQPAVPKPVSTPGR
jgi:hypothetical protein